MQKHASLLHMVQTETKTCQHELTIVELHTESTGVEIKKKQDELQFLVNSEISAQVDALNTHIICACS